MAYTKTIWVNNSSPYINANNLNKIENQLESNTNDIETNTTNIQTNTEKITNITGKILWTNQNPTSDFAQQTITLSETISNYDMYEIIYLSSTSGSRALTTGKIPKSYRSLLQTSTSYNHYRPVDNPTGTSLLIEDNQSIRTFGTVTIDNSMNIPLYVIGYNTGLF